MSLEEQRSWMYSGWNANGRHSEEWIRNTNEFLDQIFEGVRSAQFGVVCPCSNYSNEFRRSRAVMTTHLCSCGFMPTYFRWTAHGERTVNVCRTETVRDDGGLEDMVCDIGDSMNIEAEPTTDAKAFYAMLAAVQDPLHDHTTVSRLTAVTTLMSIKSQYSLPGSCIDAILKLLEDILPKGHKLPKSLYECKCLLSGLKMPFVKIDACINDCMLYYEENEHKQKCDLCDEPRYKVVNNELSKKKRKPIPRSVYRYIPFLPRIQRMFLHLEMAKHMRWHHEGKRIDAKMMVHPSDSASWKSFNEDGFASDPRNVRLVMCTDGFNPFTFGATSYSCWPVFLSPLNLPPALCLKSHNIFLSSVIPGPKGPGKKFNVYMRPLFDKLKKAWHGVPTYDSYTKETFNLRVVLHCTVHDRPAFGMAAGWSTHGGLACYECGADPQTTWLAEGHKWTWFDSHRRFLLPDHVFRTQRNAFMKDTIVHDVASPRLTGVELFAYMNHAKDNNFQGYGVTHNWVDVPKLWELPYFPKLMLPHNIDVMHTEKNVAEALFNTVMDIPGRTEDNVKALLDQAVLCSRKDFNLRPKGVDKWEKPRTPFCLNRDQKREVLQWFTKLKFPDAYVANMKRGVSLEQLKIHGLKSHDYHIIMEHLLPAMLRGYLENDVWEALAELSYFFRMLCAKEINEDQMRNLEANIPVMLCKFEKMFPPAFFDSMEHLLIHLPYEAKVGGPVQYRWMYRFERFIKKLREYVTNKARVEGSIVEAYLIEEISSFTALYLPAHVPTSRNRPARYARYDTPSSSTLSLFEDRGWKIGRGDARALSIEEYKTAMTNMPEMDSFVQQFEHEQWSRARPPSQKQLDKLRRDGAGAGKPNLIDWFKTLCIKDASINPKLRRVSRGCNEKVKSYDMYEICGYRFRSEKYETSRGELSSRNTGVLALGVDDATNKELEYYGYIKDIIELTFDAHDELKIVLFDCHWFHPTRGVRRMDRFGLTEIAHASTNPANENFVVASQVTQVYYVPYACTSNANLNAWRIAHKVPPLNWLGIPDIDEYMAEAAAPSADVFQENNDVASNAFTAQLGAGLDNLGISGVDEVVDPTELSDINMHSSLRSQVMQDEEPPKQAQNIEDIEDEVDDF